MYIIHSVQTVCIITIVVVDSQLYKYVPTFIIRRINALVD